MILQGALRKSIIHRNFVHFLLGVSLDFNGIRQPDGTLKTLPVKQVADLLGHTTSEITEIYYVKRDNNKLSGLTDSFNI